MLEDEVLKKLPSFRTRFEWVVKYRPNLVNNIASLTTPGEKYVLQRTQKLFINALCSGRRLLSLVSRNKLERVLKEMVDEDAFLSDFGLRSLSKQHLKNPYNFAFDQINTTVK